MNVLFTTTALMAVVAVAYTGIIPRLVNPGVAMPPGQERSRT